MRNTFNIADGEAKEEKEYLFYTSMNGKVLMNVCGLDSGGSG